jgi:ABC-type multidrug transport system fused ATPase/permease subunit
MHTTDTNSPLPPTIFDYILRIGGRHQIALVALSVVVFALSTVPLEIQRRIVNDAVRNGAVSPILWLALAYFGVALLEGGIKLGLNIYRGWVSEMAVLDLRRVVAALTPHAASGAAPENSQGTEVSMILTEVEPIGGFAGISISQPLLQTGVLVSVFGYLVFLQPMVALLCALAFSPQLIFVPLMQGAINRRSGERIETLRSVGGTIVDAGARAAPAAGAPADDTQERHLLHVFALNMGIFKIKFTMYFLMNLMHHLGVATALGVGGYYVVQGRIDVGTVVAFVSGLAKVNDPWGDLVDWYREMTLVRTRYKLLRDASGLLDSPEHSNAQDAEAVAQAAT